MYTHSVISTISLLWLNPRTAMKSLQVISQLVKEHGLNAWIPHPPTFLQLLSVPSGRWIILISSLHIPFLTLLNSVTWRLYFCFVSALHFLHSIPAAASSVQNHSSSKVHISIASQAVPPKPPQILPLHCSGHLSKAFFCSYWSCLWMQGFPIQSILLSRMPKHVVQL